MRTLRFLRFLEAPRRPEHGLALVLPSFKKHAYCVLYAGLGLAVTIPVERRDAPHAMTVHIASTDADPYGFKNVHGTFYSGRIMVAGEPFDVLLDTGSTDLWLDTKGVNLSGVKDTGVFGGVIYEDGRSVAGNITQVDISWGNFSVKDQVFINAPGTNATSGQFDGLLGLGPPSLAFVPQFLQNASSTVNSMNLLDNIFSLYPDESNYITFLLSRSIVGTVDGGDFTIGEITPGYEAISKAPQLLVESDRWLTFMDAMIINGKRVTGESVGYQGIQVPKGKTTAIFDTGITLDIAPRSFVDAMFKDIPGAEFDDDFGLYRIPCDAKVNVSLVFGDDVYPIHPMDIVAPLAVNGSDPICFGGFLAAPEMTTFGDFQFGDIVLRNLYTLFDFGKWARVGDSQPFIQIISLTDADKAWAEFDTMNPMRLQEFVASNPLSITSTTSGAPALPSSTSDTTAAGALSDDDSTSSSDLTALIRNSYIIIGLLGFAILMLVALVLVTFVKSRTPSGKRYRGLKEAYPPTHEEQPIRYSD